MTLISRLRYALFGNPIRIASDEGRLLGLQVGQRVILDEILLVVAQRDEMLRAGNPGVRYLLVTHDEASGRFYSPDAPFLLNPCLPESGLTMTLERCPDGSEFRLDCRLNESQNV